MKLLTAPAILAMTLVVTGGCTSSRPSAEPAMSPTADIQVSAEEVTVEIAVAPRTEWRWHTDAGPVDGAEYEWQIYLGDPEMPRHSFGFLLFRHSGAEPGAGTLDELIGAGQSNVWVMREGRFTVMSAHVSAEVVGDRLHLRLAGGPVIEELFGDRPAEVTLGVRAPGSPRQTETIPVRYARR